MSLQVENIFCRRGLRPVLRAIAFSLDSSAALIVTGPNGSGKSSLLRVLAGLLPASQGMIRWNGESVDWATHRARVHYVGHQDALKPELTVRETLNYWHALRPIENTKVLPATFGLDALHNRPVRTLSAGQKRRLALARLRISDAPLWLLDEPATSLDRAGQDILAGLITEHRATGGIVVIATHHGLDIPDVQELALQPVARKESA